MTSFDESHFGISLISEKEKTTIPTLSEINTEGQGSVSSFHKRTSTVWNNFEKVIVDEVIKVKYKKYVKLYSYASSGRTDHLKRHQESHIMSDTRLQSILNIQGDSLIGSFVYNHKN